MSRRKKTRHQRKEDRRSSAFSRRKGEESFAALLYMSQGWFSNSSTVARASGSG